MDHITIMSAAALALAACTPGPSDTPIGVASTPDPPPPVAPAHGIESPPEEPPVSCIAAAARLVICPDDAHAERWAKGHHQHETTEATLAAALAPADPVAIEDGLTLYRRALLPVSHATRANLDLWDNTPPLSPDDVATFERRPRLWRSVVRFRSARPGAPRVRAFNKELARWRRAGDREAIRHLVTRSGVFYFEDPTTARVAARTLKLSDLFETDEVVLARGGRAWRLRQTDRGYVYEAAEMQGYRGRLSVFDRVWSPRNQPAPLGYELASLRRVWGLERVTVEAESETGREAEIRLWSNTTMPARLVRTETGSTLVVVGDPRRLLEDFEQSRRAHSTLEDVIASADAMVRENLFFDEPANEEGQQDGIMRLAFARAYRAGQRTYEVNGVTYRVFDAAGRPRPPQVCIDLVVDAVERSGGSWWPRRQKARRARSQGVADLRGKMPFRQVTALLDIPARYPHVATRYDLQNDSVPFRRRSRFYKNLEAERDALRLGDIIVIYGLRDDERNHFHSFYVHDTDPIFGIPTAVVDQAGHVRVRAWDAVMRSAPRRSIRSRVRWNPRWLASPRAMDTASEVAATARRAAGASTEG